ncbi:HSP20-like chaperone [Cladochytrium replicatum]|nr:HSP20-like chaperone [Cladochytrium replicatum]
MTSQTCDPFSIFDRDPFFREFDDYVRNRVNTVFADQTQGLITHNAVRKHSQPTTYVSKWIHPPRVDVSENEDEYLIRADLPGLKQEDSQIQLKDGPLTIEGERKEERSGAQHFYERSYGKFYERSYGKFSRQLKLPADVDVEKTSARMADGVVELMLGKRLEPKQNVRQISFQ